MYFNSRYYDPELGIFLSPDTLVPDPEVFFNYNRYMYVRGNPLRFNDPTGHVERTCFEMPGDCTEPEGGWPSGRAGGGRFGRGPIRGASNRPPAEPPVKPLPNAPAANGGTQTNLTEPTITATGNASATTLQAGDVGTFGQLNRSAVTGDELTPHHMPQAAGRWTSYKQGGAMMMTTEEHQQTRTFGGRGNSALQEDAGLSFRQVLAKDIQDVRQVTSNMYGDGTYYNQSLLKLIEFYSVNHPTLMNKSGPK